MRLAIHPLHCRPHGHHCERASCQTHKEKMSMQMEIAEVSELAVILCGVGDRGLVSRTLVGLPDLPTMSLSTSAET